VQLDGNSSLCHIEWYKGPLGDKAQSQFVSSSTWDTSITTCVTSATTYWARVYGIDEYNGNPADGGMCYTDSSAVTVTP
jgi:hypothetical protein